VEPELAPEAEIEPEPALEPAPPTPTPLGPAPVPPSAFELQPTATTRVSASLNVAERGLKGMLRVLLSLERRLWVRLLTRYGRNTASDELREKIPRADAARKKHAYRPTNSGHSAEPSAR